MPLDQCATCELRWAISWFAGLQALTNKPIIRITFPNRPNTLRPPTPALLGGAVNPPNYLLLIQSICHWLFNGICPAVQLNQIGSTW